MHQAQQKGECRPACVRDRDSRQQLDCFATKHDARGWERGGASGSLVSECCQRPQHTLVTWSNPRYHTSCWHSISQKASNCPLSLVTEGRLRAVHLCRCCVEDLCQYKGCVQAGSYGVAAWSVSRFLCCVGGMMLILSQLREPSKDQQEGTPREGDACWGRAPSSAHRTAALSWRCPVQ